jgi:hypothetical protein
MIFSKKIQHQCQLVCSKADTRPTLVLTILTSFLGWEFTPTLEPTILSGFLSLELEF